MRSLRKLLWLLANTKRSHRRRLKRKGCKKLAARGTGDEESLAAWSKLPLDLKEEVLTYLPFAQVFEYRLVCKQWHRMLSSPAFRKRNLAFQKACSWCVIVSDSRDVGDSIGSGFDPQCGSWQAMPPIPAELGYLTIFASDKGLLIALSTRLGSLCVYNPLLQTYRLLPPSGEEDEESGWGMYLHLMVGDAASFKVFQFSFYGERGEKLPLDRLVPPLPNQLGIQDVLVPLKDGFSKVRVYNSASDSWSLLPNKPPLNFSRSNHPDSPPKGPCTDVAGVFWFEWGEERSSPVTSLLAFDKNEGVWKEQLRPPMEEGADTDGSVVMEHLVQCGTGGPEFLFLRTTTNRTSVENKLRIVFDFYRFDGLTDRWVTVRRTSIHLPPFHPSNFPLLLALLMGNHVVCKHKVLWFTVDLGEVIAFDMADGKWRHYFTHYRRKEKTTPFSFVPSLINLSGMASAIPTR